MESGIDLSWTRKGPRRWLVLSSLTLVPVVLLYCEYRSQKSIASALTAHTRATIVSTDYENHSTVRYTYMIQGQGRTYDFTQNGGPEGLKPGDQIMLHYDPRDPEHHTLGSIEMTSVAGAIVQFVTIDVMIVWVAIGASVASWRFAKGRVPK